MVHRTEYGCFYPCEAKEAADKVLDEFVGFAEELNIKYFLYCGTCLGFYREKAHIKTHNDIDILIVADVRRRAQLFKALIEHGFIGGKAYPRNRHFFKNRILVDVWLHIPNSVKPFIQKADKVVYNGKEYNVPSPIEKFLEKQYGDWKTPSLSKPRHLKMGD